MSDTIAIIDYGSGNLRSAAKAFERVIADEGLGFDVTVTSDADTVRGAARIVLPGQGAFGSCMDGLGSVDGMLEALEEAVIQKGTPFLGICVGMQLMATRGLEHGIHGGLGWIPGQVAPMEPADKNLKIPHMGWNTVYAPSPGDQDNRHPVLRGMQPDDHFYFVHSFVFQCEDTHHILALSDYGGPVTAVVGRDNMVGVQFHPEKSQKAGLRLIADFLHWDP